LLLASSRTPFLDGDPDAPVADHIGHTDQFHVVLGDDGVGNAFADDAVAIYCYSDLRHFDLLLWV
jgi:hypothetical protein